MTTRVNHVCDLTDETPVSPMVGYVSWFDGVHTRFLTHGQMPCPTCGLFAVRKRERKKPITKVTFALVLAPVG